MLRQPIQAESSAGGMTFGGSAMSIRPRVLLFSSLYPSSARPGHGIFVATRLRQLVAGGAVDARVVAPVPWFFSTDRRFGEYAVMARTPRYEAFDGVETWHPRYLLPPKVGMEIAPFAMAAGAFCSVRRLIRQGFDFDAIDAHYYYPDGVAAALLARHFNKPFVVTARGSDVNIIASHAVPRRLMLWAARRADTSIAVSEALASAMVAIGMTSQRIEVLRNGVDLTRFRSHSQADARRRLGWPDAPTLIAVGNLLESKGQHVALEALASLPDFRLCCVGSGPQAGFLQSLARRLGVAERVLFCGSVAQDLLSLYYSASDILVLPSTREGTPNVVLESLACGTPVVATAVGGIPEVVSTPIAGRLTGDRSAAQLVNAVRDLWAHGIDRQAVRAHASRFGWADTTRGQLDIFRRLAHGNSISRQSGSAVQASGPSEGPR
jgi:teichuronic acid biosynthesis glycosyltransferase TuaC